VVLFHAIAPSLGQQPGSIAARIVYTVLGTGWFGVHLFFVISGYCIGACVSSELRQNRRGGRFLLDRFTRIFPTYWIACLLSVILGLIALPFNHGHLLSAPGQPGVLPGTFGDALTSFLILEPWRNQISWQLVSWTLAYELAYYIVMAAGLWVVHTLGLRERTLLLLACCLSVAAWFVPEGLPGAAILRLWPEFMAGFLVANIRRTLRQAPWEALAWICLLGGLGAAAIAISGLPNTTPWAVLFALLLVLLIRWDLPFAQWKGARWLGSIGVFSYSLYLVHVPIISPLRNAAMRVLPPDAWWMVVIVASLAAIACSYLFYSLAERPIEKVRHRLFRNRVSAPQL
jgi:peptidoglycan/LPS O-acetylase OafA/YrhL